jgi:hypothetical protein
VQDEVKREAEKLRAETQSLKDSLKQAEAKAAVAAELEAKLVAAQAQLAAVAEASPAPKAAELLVPAPEAASANAGTTNESFPVSATEPVAVSPTPVDEVESSNAPEPVAEGLTSDITISESVEATAVSSPKATKGEKTPATSDATKSVKKAKKVKKASATSSDVAPLSNASANPVVEPPFEPVGDDNSWSSLSDAALKRKTVKELSDFLTARVR